LLGFKKLVASKFPTQHTGGTAAASFRDGAAGRHGGNESMLRRPGYRTSEKLEFSTSAARGEEPLLVVRNVGIEFGGIAALKDVSFDVPRGEIVGLIGPNGAGKTTLFNCLSRIYHPTRGDILLENRSILEQPQHRIAAMGIGRTFQNVALFSTLSVRDNIRIGGHSITKGDAISDMIRLPNRRRTEERLDEVVREISEFLDLQQVEDLAVASLPFGTQKRVELGRALAMKPKILLLDEPAGGLNHEEVFALGNLIVRIRDRLGITILLVEHHMGLVMSIADRVVALNFGEKLSEGTPAYVQSDASVIKAYLGSKAT
jgi:branched-chain amino acid transport system ATP-binding protein